MDVDSLRPPSISQDRSAPSNISMHPQDVSSLFGALHSAIFMKLTEPFFEQKDRIDRPLPLPETFDILVKLSDAYRVLSVD